MGRGDEIRGQKIEEDKKDKIPQNELELRRVLVEKLCPQKHIEARSIGDDKVEYKIAEPDVLSFLVKNYPMPLSTAQEIINHMFRKGLIGFHQSKKCAQWYYVLITDSTRSLKGKVVLPADTKYPHKTKLRAQLLEWQKEGKKMDLMEFTYFCRLLTNALSEDMRWKKCTELSKEFKLSEEGQELPETILEHTGIDTPLLCAMMLARERKEGTKLNYEIHNLLATLHDLPEAISLKGDVDYVLKDSEDDKKEDEALVLLISILSDDAKEYFEEVAFILEDIGLSKRFGKDRSEISLDAQFFWAVEIAGYLSRALYEIRAGNLAFCDPFFTQQADIEYFCKKFVSFRELVDPYLEFMKKFRREHKDAPWRIKKKS